MIQSINRTTNIVSNKQKSFLPVMRDPVEEKIGRVILPNAGGNASISEVRLLARGEGVIRLGELLDRRQGVVQLI